MVKSFTSVMAQRPSVVRDRTNSLWSPNVMVVGMVITRVTSTESPEVKAVSAVPRPTPGSVSMKYSIPDTLPDASEEPATTKKDRASVCP